MDFQEFCERLGVKEPTQGLGYAYHYAKLSSELLEESYGDTPLQCTIESGACVVVFRTDLFDVGGSLVSQWVSTLRNAQNFSLRRQEGEVIVSAVFRL